MNPIGYYAITGVPSPHDKGDADAEITVPTVAENEKLSKALSAEPGGGQSIAILLFRLIQLDFFPILSQHSLNRYVSRSRHE